MIKKNLLFVCSILFIAILLQSCDIINPDEKNPSYVVIDSVNVASDYATYGTSSHKISDVWLYANDNLVGCYELPARIPVLLSGETKLTLLAGIKVNGISGTRASYPFYKGKIFTENLIEGSSVHINPVFEVDPSTTKVFYEDFENAGTTLEKTSNSDTSLLISNNQSEVYKNYQNLTEISNKSGLVCITQNKPKFEIQTKDAFVMPKKGNYVFLEMNYKCTSPIVVGLMANYSSQIIKSPIIVLNPTDKWNKVYVNLTIAISQEIDANDFRFYFTGAIRDGVTEDNFWFDNIKLIRAATSK